MRLQYVVILATAAALFPQDASAATPNFRSPGADQDTEERNPNVPKFEWLKNIENKVGPGISERVQTSSKLVSSAPPMRSPAFEKALAKMSRRGLSDDYSTLYLKTYHDLGFMELPPGNILKNTHFATKWFQEIKRLNSMPGVTETLSVPVFLRLLHTDEDLMKIIRGADRENKYTKQITDNLVRGLLQKWQAEGIPKIVKTDYSEFWLAYLISSKPKQLGGKHEIK